MEDDTERIEELVRYIHFDYGFRSPYILRELNSTSRSAKYEGKISDDLKNVLSGTVDNLYQGLSSGLRNGNFPSQDIALLTKAMKCEKLYYDRRFYGLKVHGSVKACVLRCHHDEFSISIILNYLRERLGHDYEIITDDFIDAASNLKREQAWNIFLGIVCILGVPLGSLVIGAIVGMIPASIIHKIVEAAVGFSFKNFKTIYLTCCSAFAIAGAALGIILFSINFFKSDLKNYIKRFRNLSNEEVLFAEQKDIDNYCYEVDTSVFGDEQLSGDRQSLLCRGESTNSNCEFESVSVDSDYEPFDT
jgi:hypothetical protein